MQYVRLHILDARDTVDAALRELAVLDPPLPSVRGPLVAVRAVLDDLLEHWEER